MRLLAFVLLVSCGLEADVPQTLSEKVARAYDHMHRRYAATSRITRAIAFGDLDRARSEARTVGATDEPEALAKWQPYFESVRQAAGRIAEADNLTSAANALADVGIRCARCHEAAAARIDLPRVSPPSETLRLHGQMTEHQWAVDRMWDGLIARDDAAWTRGASTLAGSRLAITAEEGSLGIADDAARVHAYAADARKTKSIDDRGQLFGKLMATCAHCHATIRDR